MSYILYFHKMVKGTSGIIISQICFYVFYILGSVSMYILGLTYCLVCNNQILLVIQYSFFTLEHLDLTSYIFLSDK